MFKEFAKVGGNITDDKNSYYINEWLSISEKIENIFDVKERRCMIIINQINIQD